MAEAAKFSSLSNIPSAAPVARVDNREFLDAITIEHGPIQLLGRLFLKATMAASNRGIRLELSTLEALEKFNREHLKDWPMLPVFKPSLLPAGTDPSTTFSVLGRNGVGEIVATQAARLFDWQGTTLTAEAESLRMFFGGHPTEPIASCEVSAPEGERITGRIAYSGATWFRPEYRGRELSGILPRISRALALTRWNTECTISFMDWRIVKKGVAASYGYTNLARSITLRHIVDPEFVAAIGWIPREQLLADAETFLSDFPVDWAESSEAGRRENRG